MFHQNTKKRMRFEHTKRDSMMVIQINRIMNFQRTGIISAWTISDVHTLLEEAQDS